MGEVTHNERSVPASGRATAGESDEVVGRFYGWWRGDPLPTVPAGVDLVTAPSEDVPLVASVTGMDSEAVRERLAHGHRPWLAWVGGEPVGWGWVATREAGISELGIAITLPPEERYLWDFVTPPAWRGRGVYTALLQALLNREGAARYWIGHDEGNEASARGIVRAGFGEVGAVHRLADGRLVFVPTGSADRAEAAAAILGLPVITE